MSFTLNDIILLVIVLLAGLVIGLMISGRGKYKRLWSEERRAHRDSIRSHDARMEASNGRIADLERQAVPIRSAPTAPVTSAVDEGDNLSRIRGVNGEQEILLNEAGYHRFDQIAAMNPEQEATLEARLGLRPGTIVHDEWREQARMLSGDNGDEVHNRRFVRPGTPV